MKIKPFIFKLLILEPKRPSETPKKLAKKNVLKKRSLFFFFSGRVFSKVAVLHGQHGWLPKPLGVGGGSCRQSTGLYKL